MNNFLLNEKELPLQEKYDIKGSSYRRRLPEHKFNSGEAMKDENFMERGVRIKLFKRDAAKLLHQVQKDVEFLRSQNLMDYSMIVGIMDNHEYEAKMKKKMSTLATCKDLEFHRLSYQYNIIFYNILSPLTLILLKSKLTGLCGDYCMLTEFVILNPDNSNLSNSSFSDSELDSSNISNVNNKLRKQTDRSYCSPDGEKRYFLGIIDTLTYFSWRKRGRSFYKRTCFSKHVSIVAPSPYQFRFYRFFESAIDTSGDIVDYQVLETQTEGFQSDSNSIR